MNTDKEVYLGDGLYAKLTCGQIRLRTSRESGDHIVYLEPEVYQALLMQVEIWKQEAKRGMD